MRIASVEQTIRIIEKEIFGAKLPYIRQDLEKVSGELKNTQVRLPDGAVKKILGGIRFPQCVGNRCVFYYDDNGRLLLDVNSNLQFA